MEIQPRHVSLETLFHRRLFRIPQYQRAYSWQGKHRKALFDDISISYAMEKIEGRDLDFSMGQHRPEHRQGLPQRQGSCRIRLPLITYL